MNFKRLITIILFLIILILDWFALDDITTGNEPALLEEYLLHAFTSIIAGYFIIQKSYKFFYNLQRKIAKSALSTKYHIHHDLVGFALIILGFFLPPLWLQITISGIGAGVVIHHAVAEGLRLVTKY